MNLELLNTILHVETCSYECGAMQEMIWNHAETCGYTRTQDKTGNIYLTKGEGGTFPCMVAHMDTVHDISGDGIAIVTCGGKVTGLNPVTMKQTGIGGDDKCGIYAALHCMAALPVCKAVFFVDEEVGCAGSYDCDLEFFLDCRFVLQADRRGNGDFVTDISGALSSRAFQNAVAPLLKRHGYKPCNGMMSDVMALRDLRVGVSCANMSAGYYNPHQACEYIDLSDLENVCALMVEIGGLEKSFPFIFTPPKPIRKVNGTHVEKGGMFPDWKGAALVPNPSFYSLAPDPWDEVNSDVAMAEYEREMLRREYDRLSGDEL